MDLFVGLELGFDGFEFLEGVDPVDLVEEFVVLGFVGLEDLEVEVFEVVYAGEGVF